MEPKAQQPAASRPEQRTPRALDGPARRAARSIGFGTLARRTADWTSRLILTGVVLVAALGFGRQVLLWWSEGTAAPQGSGSSLPGHDSASQRGMAPGCYLTVGNGGSVLRSQPFVGDGESVVEHLVKLCAGAPLPTGRCGRAGVAERRLVARLARSGQSRRRSGDVDIFVLDDAMPMAVAVHWAGGRNSTDRVGPPLGEVSPAETRAGSQEDDRADAQAMANGRIAAWAMAIPIAADTWNTYCIAGGPDSAEAPGLWLPDGAKQTLSLAWPDGSRMLGFSGIGGEVTLRKWRATIDHWFAGRGYECAQTMSPRNAETNHRRWQAHYGPGAAAARDDAARKHDLPWAAVDLHLCVADNNEVRGLMVATPLQSPDGRRLGSQAERHAGTGLREE